MRQPGTVTIVATICSDKVEWLRQYLRQSVDIDEDGGERDVAFSKLGALHFCSIFIIDADQVLDKPAALVFEATIDGEIREFLENMVETSPDAFAKIFGCCEGYPASSMRLKRLVVDYLMLRLVRHRTFYCGYPGRSVSQIKAEQRLRDGVVHHLDGLNDQKITSLPTMGVIHRHLKSWLRSEGDLSWATQNFEPPAIVKYRQWYLAVLVFTTVTIPTIFISIWGYRLFDISPSNVLATVHECARELAVFRTPDPENVSCEIFPHQIFGGIFAHANSLVGIFVFLAIIWFGARAIKSTVVSRRQGTRKSLLNRILFTAMEIIVLVALVLMAFVGLLALLKLAQAAGVVSSQTGIGLLLGMGIIVGIFCFAVSIIKSATDARVLETSKLIGAAGQIEILARALLASLIRAVYYFVYAGFLLICMAVLFRLLQYFAQGLQFLWSALFGLFGVELSTPPIAFTLGEFPSYFASFAREMIYVFITAVPFFTVGFFALVGLTVSVFLLAGLLEMREKRRYQNCANLEGRDVEAQRRAYAREEHGNNLNQNHLISVVHVKKGILRQLILRTVFWAINLLAKLLYNQGTLGGIPTILSARWILIDGGKRVVFMTNYVGAWDSYINEFSDLESVRGVNAIWSNTVLPAPQDMKNRQPVNFPLSSFLLWKGAENERQLKMYIRASQVETLVWYGAYAELSVTNINNNTALRNNIMAQKSSAQMDELAKRI